MKKDRIFLDANILFSMAWGSPALSRLLALAEAGACVLVASRYVSEEARRNLESPEHQAALRKILAQVEVAADMDPGLPCPADLPEKDRHVLMAAIAGRADVLLTGDRLHFGAFFGRRLQGVRIMTVRDYFQTRDDV
ncbi:MAG: PIN domain-containing protein [Proteobacteria bacterium]|nr:PIN domain-containing protein [Pseudomonadota bacterium]